MGNYLDETFAAIDGDLLVYRGYDSVLTLPVRLADEKIVSVGQSAFAESLNLEEVIVPYGITSIGDGAFSYCPRLKTVTIPATVSEIGDHVFHYCPQLRDLILHRYPISAEQYRTYCAASSLTDGSIRLMHSFPDDPFLRELAAGADASVPAPIPHGIDRLFSVLPVLEIDNAALQKPLDGFSFGTADRFESETDAFLRLQDGIRAGIDAKAEERNDAIQKTDSPILPEKTAVFTFDDSKTEYANGQYRIEADIRFGFHFWQSKVPVVYGSKTYCIYSRCFATSVKDLGYIRKDVAVFSGRWPVKSREEATEIYAKYRLLMLL